MEKKALLLDRDSLEDEIKAYGNWFYWIAGLSLVNTLILIMTEGKFVFIFSLGANQIVNTMFASNTTDAKLAIGLLFADILISCVFVLFGYLGHLGKKWGYILGITLYLLDTLLLFWQKGDIKAIAFHVFALVFMFRVFLAFRKYRKIDKRLMRSLNTFVQGYDIENESNSLTVNSTEFPSININRKNNSSGFKVYVKGSNMNKSPYLYSTKTTISESAGLNLDTGLEDVKIGMNIHDSSNDTIPSVQSADAPADIILPSSTEKTPEFVTVSTKSEDRPNSFDLFEKSSSVANTSTPISTSNLVDNVTSYVESIKDTSSQDNITGSNSEVQLEEASPIFTSASGIDEKLEPEVINTNNDIESSGFAFPADNNSLNYISNFGSVNNVTNTSTNSDFSIKGTDNKDNNINDNPDIQTKDIVTDLIFPSVTEMEDKIDETEELKPEHTPIGNSQLQSTESPSGSDRVSDDNGTVDSRQNYLSDNTIYYQQARNSGDNKTTSQVDKDENNQITPEKPISLFRLVRNKLLDNKNSTQKPQKIYSQSYIVEEDPEEDEQ